VALAAGTQADPEITRILKEKANRQHARIVSLLDAKARASGLTPMNNVYVDLFVNYQGSDYIIEVKSCNPGNLLPQVRRGVGQLYEYRYRAQMPGAHLWLVLEERPADANSWLESYLVDDRDICLGWLEGDATIRCHPSCDTALDFACA